MRRLGVTLAVFAFATAACGMSPVPEKYRRFIIHNADHRSIPETVLNVVGLTTRDIGRSFALVAGVDTYPKLKGEDRFLAPAAVDLDRLVPFLRDRQYYDEIVVLRNDAVTDENLKFFLQVYFPERLKSFPRSRFLFAYSGHGIQEGARGYLLLSGAESKDDKANSISLEVVRTLYQEIVDSAYQSLALINACYSGGFLTRSFSIRRSLVPTEPGAHAITAAGSRQLAWHVDNVGQGSLFFEKFFAGVDGRADTLPLQADGTAGDGIVTEPELWAYLSTEIELQGEQRQNPREGDISRDGSLGGLFFVTRTRTRVAARLPPKITDPEGHEFGPSTKWQALTPKGDLGKDASGKSESELVAGCNAGSTEDCLSLGIMYGRAGLNDLSVRPFQRSCDAGDRTGCLYAGESLEDLSDEAFGLGHDRTRCHLGELKSCLQLVSYTNIVRDDRKDLEPSVRANVMAVDYYKRACDLGSGLACWYLGMATLIGEGGLKADREKATTFFRETCDRGYGGACIHLANQYELDGVPRATIAALYRKSCDQGFGEGCFRLGVFYRAGDGGLLRSSTKAQELFEQACLRGSANGCWWAVQPYLDGTRPVIDPKKTTQFLELGCWDGNELACSVLGEWYEKGGKGPPQDLAKAAYYYQQACQVAHDMFSLQCAQAKDLSARLGEAHRAAP